jgi:hypothetical protein
MLAWQASTLTTVRLNVCGLNDDGMAQLATLILDQHLFVSKRGVCSPNIEFGEHFEIVGVAVVLMAAVTKAKSS